MEKSTTKNHESNGRARWIALFALAGINYLNYIDRYIFSALLPAIKAELHFTDTELGVLGSAFIYVYMFSAPLFGHLGDKGSRSKIMAVGVAIWSGATAFSGICTSFLGQFFTRAAVGFGESAYSVIAPSSIADYFSKESRGKIFAIYSGAITIGSALGYVLGGLLESAFGWRQAFFAVGIPGLILAALLYFIPDPKRGQFDEQIPESDRGMSIKNIYIELVKNGGFIFTVLGYSAYTFVVGGLAFWMPMYLVRYFDVTLKEANVQFGAMTVAGGFVGTVLGGFWSDRIERKNGNGFLKVSFYSMIVAMPIFFFSLKLTDYSQFMAALFFLEVALFICTSPLDAAVIGYVRPAWRATAMALNVFLIHFLGDGISRLMLGYLSDKSELRIAMGYLPWALLVSALFWFIGFVWFWQPVRWSEKSFKLPLWQAHRGFCPAQSGVQENTLAAFREALQAGAEMIECDVQLTSDRRAVVFHDADLKRLGNESIRVVELSAQDMAKRVQAPLLEELLEDKGIPRFVNIEIKSHEGLFGRGLLEIAVWNAVRSTNSSDRVIFSSFNPFALHRLAKLAPAIPRALIATEYENDSNKKYLSKMLLGFWAKVQLVHLDEKMINSRRMAQWRERGIKVVAWTVNERSRAQELMAMGVVGFISDKIFTEA